MRCDAAIKFFGEWLDEENAIFNNRRVKKWVLQGLLFFLIGFSMNFLCAGNLFESGDIPMDPDAVCGVLNNGLRYCIVPHGEPPNRVSMRLYIAAGSLMEKESQRGIAHFLEHMAFSGSENFSQGDLVESLQRLGMRFGSHNNAYTSQEETVYKLELPKNDRRTLKEALLVFRDFLGGLSLEEGEAQRERGVILSELRHCDTPQYRDNVDFFQFLFPYSIIAKRMPIGEAAVINSTTAASLRKFYETYYGAKNAILLVVGDVDVPMLQQCIQHVVGDLPASPTSIPPVNIGSFRVSGTRVHVHKDEELPRSTITIAVVHAVEDFQDNQELRREELLLRVAEHVMIRRLQKLCKVPNSAFYEGSCSSDYFAGNNTRVAWMWLSGPDDRMADAIRLGEQELRRATEFRFGDGEIDIAVKNILQQLKNARDQASSRRSDLLADDWTMTIGAGRVCSSMDWDYEFAKSVLHAMEPDDVWNAFRSLWSPRNRQIYVSGNLPKNFSETMARNAFVRSQHILLNRESVDEIKTFSYRNFGTPGIVKTENHDQQLGLHSYVFENGVRLNVKATDFESKQVHVRMRIGQGLLSEPRDAEGLSKFAQWSLLDGGLEKHSLEDVRDLFAGKIWSIRFDVSPEAFLFSSRTTDDDFLDQLSLLAAYVSDAGFSSLGELEGKKCIPQAYSELGHTIQGVMSNGVTKFLHCDDRRFGFPAQQTMDGYFMEDVRRWISPALRNGYLEITVVGDVDVGRVVEDVAHTLGALPTRTGQPLPINNPMPLPAGKSGNFTYETNISKGYVQCLWPTGDMWNIQQKRCLDLLGDILLDR
ncbi:MAG: insulinase family protein, partial [Puniceicoccales bacterium]|nr:insulinase family protein [Puniceicoccales bacterium]